jgi:hypothetical protein
LINIKAADIQIPVALHVSLTSPFSRKPHEFRYQNPANRSPATTPRNSFPLLVGVNLLPSPLLVVTDGRSRVGRRARFSILFNERIMANARQTGWSEYISTSGEHIFAIHPRMLPVLVELLSTDILLPEAEMVLATQASGLAESAGNDEVLTAAANRARRAAYVLVRQARFGNDVKKAYGGKCAMCGLGINLVQGAHIHPVSALGSHDKVWNGLALCHNHHGLFDSHRLWIDPGSLEVVKHPTLVSSAISDPIVKTFLDQTLDTLRPPQSSANRPKPSMFEARYSFFDGLYDWR